MQMKDATAKNQLAGYEDEKDGNYKMRYTTSPKKGYIVKPKKGEIKYENYNQKNPDKFIQNINKQELEVVEFQTGRKAAGSPIKVTKKTMTRAEEVSYFDYSQQYDVSQALSSAERHKEDPFDAVEEEYSEPINIEQRQATEEAERDVSPVGMNRSSHLIEGRM